MTSPHEYSSGLVDGHQLRALALATNLQERSVAGTEYHRCPEQRDQSRGAGLIRRTADFYSASATTSVRHFSAIIQSLRETDRQVDRQTDRQTESQSDRAGLIQRTADFYSASTTTSVRHFSAIIQSLRNREREIRVYRSAGPIRRIADFYSASTTTSVHCHYCTIAIIQSLRERWKERVRDRQTD